MAKKNQVPALGRGLSALLNDDAIEWSTHKKEVIPPAPEGALEISLVKIEANPNQPRTEFNEEALQELANSIKMLGLIQPITLRKIDEDKYQIISGERRFRAAKMAGLTSVPAYIRKADDKEILTMALVENIQREDLDALEIAISYQRLIDECSLTQEELADKVGKKRTTVTNYIRLLKLPAKIQLLLRSNALTMGHARALLSIDNDKKRLSVANKIIKNDLSVRATEQLISNMDKKVVQPQVTELPETYYKVLDIIGKHFNNDISIKRNEKGEGSLTIRFKSDAEMESFLQSIEQTKK